jgi:pyruvate/2-oxoglutarate/acetoin dehydrogenase E1 component
MFFEPKRIYRARQGRGPEGEYTSCRSARPPPCARASDVTVVCWGAMVHEAREAVPRPRMKQGNRSVELIDLRTLCRSMTSTRWSLP